MWNILQRTVSLHFVFSHVKTSVHALIDCQYCHSYIYFSRILPESNSSPSTAPTLGKEDWKKELVNSSHSHMIKGLKPGTSYRVRVVARDLVDSTVHSTDEVLVSVPGEAACLRISGLHTCLACLILVSAPSHHQTSSDSIQTWMYSSIVY